MRRAAPELSRRNGLAAEREEYGSREPDRVGMLVRGRVAGPNGERDGVPAEGIDE